MRSFTLLLSAMAMTIAFCAPLAAQGTGEALPPGVDPVTGFRMQRYRAPTPETLPGGRVVRTADVQDAMADGRTLLQPMLQKQIRQSNLCWGHWKGR